jgi:hypothetical protein
MRCVYRLAHFPYYFLRPRRTLTYFAPGDADAYSFANNEPVALLNGAQLLGLLEKHGYSSELTFKRHVDLIRPRCEKAWYANTP